jgi:hypothetical protein
MGLDMVELVMRIEETFGIAIPDAAASHLLMPNDVTDYILTRVEVSGVPLPCLTQKAFHLLRRSFTRTLQTPRRTFRPDATLESLLPDEGAEDAWSRIGRDAGVKGWPSVFRPRWLRALMSPDDCRSVRGLIDHVLAHDPLGVKGDERRWTRAQVEEVLRRAIEDETGVKDFTGASRFVDDMGLD